MATKEKSTIPTGNDFLPKTRINYLRKMHKNESDHKVAKKLLVYIKRKEGMSIRQICGALEMSYTTVRNWLRRAVIDGLAGRHAKKIPGRPCWLDQEQLEQLREELISGPQACGFDSGVWTAPLAVEHVRRRYGIQYADRSMYDLLVKLGFSCRKPRPRHPKSASEEEKKEFKKKARLAARYYAKKRHTVLSGDETSHIIGWNIKNGWYLKGEPVTTPVSLSRKRFYSFGALGQDGVFYCAFYKKANGISFIRFVRRLHKKFGKIVLFVDNASYHKSKYVKKEIKKFNGEVVIKYFLPCTPELDAMEGQWRILKKATANTLYETTSGMKKSIRRMIRRGEIKVAKMSRYLTL